MPRTSDGRERLIEAGVELFSQRPYGSIGVAELCTRAGVNKGSFYYFFASKEALALAVIDRHWTWQKGVWAGILDGPGSLLDRLRGLFDATAQMQVDAVTGTGWVAGCLFGNLALEVSSQNEPVRLRLQEIFDEQIAMIASRLASAVESGELRSVTDVDGAAKAIVAQLEGLVLFAKVFNDPSQLDALWQNSLALLGLAPARA
ncbi:TetR/AcrR family transcriptional regulator [Promicromonospora kroppenstedtii]|uniref:TetR/AcrR family transcriptional regulator n=1 Tax=Promicromonospora kroppenstedtii TaxID=440482 RepID=UPI000566248B|nr:TetR/AcrR family transcriptional regulator [Promicromonospora kroppenstedtii]